MVLKIFKETVSHQPYSPTPLSSALCNLSARNAAKKHSTMRNPPSHKTAKPPVHILPSPSLPLPQPFIITQAFHIRASTVAAVAHRSQLFPPPFFALFRTGSWVLTRRRDFFASSFTRFRFFAGYIRYAVYPLGRIAMNGFCFRLEKSMEWLLLCVCVR